LVPFVVGRVQLIVRIVSFEEAFVALACKRILIGEVFVVCEVASPRSEDLLAGTRRPSAKGVTICGIDVVKSSACKNGWVEAVA
jgi:hypothetical protein